LGRFAAVEPIGLGAEYVLDFGIEVEAKKSFGQRACKRSDAKLRGEGKEALVVVVHLADDPRTDVIAPVEQLLLDLVFDDLPAFLDDKDLFEPYGEIPHP